MALDTKPQNLVLEGEYALSVVEIKLAGVRESIARYCGPDRGGKTGDSPAPENTEFEFISYASAMLAFDRPIFTAESPLISKQDDVLALEVALNRWSKDTKFREQLVCAVPDFCFAWTVFVTSRRPAPELGEVTFESDDNGATRRGVPYRPYTKRLPFRNAFKDPLATSPYDFRFAGHIEVLDKEDQIKEAEDNPKDGWNLPLIRTLPVDSDLQRVGRQPSPGNPTRNEIVRWRIWVADAEIDWETECLDEKGNQCPEKDRGLYHGKIFTLAMAINGDGKAEGMEIKKGDPFFGPRWGPYTFIGAHVVPDDPWFMSPIQPIASSIRRLNKLTDLEDASAAAYARMIFTNDLVEDLAQRIRDGRHDGVLALPGYEKGSAEQFEKGGVTAPMMLHTSMARDKVDRGLGMSNVQRGAVEGDAPATEIALATEAAGARMASMQRNWSYGISQVGLTNAYYFWVDDEVAQPISIQEYIKVNGSNPQSIAGLIKRDDNGNVVTDLRTGKPKLDQPHIFGGTDDPTSFDSLSLEVQVYSMKHMSEGVAAQQAMFLMNYVTTVLPLAPQMPHAAWGWINRRLEKLTGIDGFRDIMDLETVAMLAESEALMRAAEQEAGDGPQLAGNVGAAKKGAQSAQSGQSAMQRPGQAQGGQANAPKAQAKPMPGRQSGGASGDKAKKQAVPA